MKVKVYNGNILYITFENQKELTLTMGRPQEFYECKSSRLRGKVFTFEEMIDHYTDKDGYISYFSYWSGFNIPCCTLEDFFSKFKINEREQKLRKVTERYKNKPYYVVATKTNDTETLQHELVHAHYYLNPVYKQEVNVLIKNMRIELKNDLSQKLKKMGYSNGVLIDEINAYMSTSGIKYLRNDLCLEISKRDTKPFEELAKLVLHK